MENLLEAKHLTKNFGGLVAVNDVSLHVSRCEILGLIGPNGAGKTTLLNAMSGLNPPTLGTIFFQGKETTGFSPDKMCHLGLARTFQIPSPFSKMTVLENVMVAAVFGQKWKRKIDYVRRCMEKLDFVEFSMDENSICETLNTVQLKRLDLARALASEPKLIFLDELASGLTEGELNELISIIRKIRSKDITIIMVEHIMQVIMNLCDRLVVLQFGNKIADGMTQEVVQNSAVREAYIGTED